jgi:hypothetical protein
MIVRISPGISCTLEDVEGVFSRADCSEQEPFVAMGRMGLTIINPMEGI